MLDEFEISPEMLREQDIKESAQTLDMVNYEIAELSRIKEELEARLAALVEHGDDGQKTYTYGKYKITVSTGYIYGLDKEEYEANKNHIPDCFNPVKTKVVYEIDKRILKDIEKYGDEANIEQIYSFVSKKPKKLHVKVSAGV
jgi:hypothetical protein